MTEPYWLDGTPNLTSEGGRYFRLVGDDGGRPSHLPADPAPSEHLTAAATRPRFATATGHSSERSTAPARRRRQEFLEQESPPADRAPSVQGLPRHVRDRTPTITAPSRRAPTSPGSRPLPCTARCTRPTSAPEPWDPDRSNDMTEVTVTNRRADSSANQDLTQLARHGAAALAYTEALTRVADATVADAFGARHDALAEHFSPEELLEIIGIVINMNVWTRLKLAEGSSPGFAEQAMS